MVMVNNRPYPVQICLRFHKPISTGRNTELQTQIERSKLGVLTEDSCRQKQEQKQELHQTLGT